MNHRTLGGLLAIVALAGAGCESEPTGADGGDGGGGEARGESTPAANATEGVEPALAGYYTQTLRWEDCGDEFQCATARVPLDYDDPGGEEIELSLLRAPATGDERLGSLLVNPGGPGGSGVEYAKVAGSVVTEQVREHYDIVGFDPRGVGESAPLDCLSDSELDEYLAADATPDDEGEVSEMQELIDNFAAACEGQSGDLLPHLGTMNVARDLDVLRSALGDEKINYLGKSYGTYIGALYAELFPDRVGRLVLDGAIDPTLTGQEMSLGQVRGFERALSAFLDWCIDRDDCAVGRSEAEARQTIRDLFAQTDEEPLPTGDDNRPLTESLAFYGLILPLYLTAEEGYGPLNQALAMALEEDDGSMLLTFADLYLERNTSGEYNGNQNEVISVVNCLDHPETTTVDQVQARVLPQFEKASPIFGPFMAWGGVGCAEFPRDETEANAGPTTAKGADPILVVGTTGDPATPYEWAEGLASQLASGVLVTYESSVHTAYLAGSDCVDEVVDKYLLDGTVPEGGARCAS